MSDVMSHAQRLENMRRIQGRNTGPEREVQKLLDRWGFPYEMQVRGLPGRPDFVLRDQGLVILVHGCFWHRHHCPEGQPWPKQNAEFWRAKLLGNQARDQRFTAELEQLGWHVELVWECELRKPAALEQRLLPLLLHPPPSLR